MYATSVAVNDLGPAAESESSYPLLQYEQIPTLSLKKISISSKTTVFLLLTAGITFTALLFYTFETLLFFGVIYLVLLPLSIFIFKNKIIGLIFLYN